VHSPELRKLRFLRALGGEWGTGRSVGSSAVPATSGRCAGAGSDARRGLAKRWTISCGTCLLSWSLAVPNVISGGVGRIQAVPVLIMYDKRMFLSSAGLPVCRLPVWQDLHAGSDEHACPGFASSAATPAACGLGSRLLSQGVGAWPLRLLFGRSEVRQWTSGTLMRSGAYCALWLWDRGRWDALISWRQLMSGHSLP
jgi:hypothetical protein